MEYLETYDFPLGETEYRITIAKKGNRFLVLHHGGILSEEKSVSGCHRFMSAFMQDKLHDYLREVIVHIAEAHNALSQASDNGGAWIGYYKI